MTLHRSLVTMTITMTMTLVLVACGDQLRAGKEPRPDTASTTAPAATAPPAAAAAAPVELRFDASAGQCVPEPVPSVVRNWQVAAPRTPPVTSSEVRIGLRNKMAGPNAMEAAAGVPNDARYALPAPEDALWARVTAPDGTVHRSATLSLLPEPPTSWISLGYPGDFADGPPLQPGTYTIVWTTDRGPIACDGFSVS